MAENIFSSNLLPVKAEHVDVIIPLVDPGDSEDVNPRKKRKQMAVMVVVPTLQEVNQRRRAAWLQRKQESEVKSSLAKYKHLKVKKGPKELPGFHLDTISRRLEDKLGPPGQRDFHVNTENEVQFMVAPRQFFSSKWGGNPQETFPAIGKEFLKKHGLNDFMYPNLLWNPHGPEIPGSSAIFFEPNGFDGPGEDSPDIFRVIVRLKEGPIWLYVGQYILLGSPSLTKNEWLQQDRKVRNTWAKEILRKGWGSDVRTRVALRKQLHRNPTKAEFEAALKADAVPVTQDDIRNAYDNGEECLGVYVLKCVGYDEAFQRKVFDDIKTWVPPPKRAKKESGKKPKTRKRKAAPEDSDAGDVFDDEEEEVVEEWIPRGTKSRPRN